MALLGAQPAAGASMTFTPCPDTAAFSCASLPVPLTRSGAVPGSIALSVRRRLAGARASTDAVVGLAGGPGQAALPLSEFMAEAIAPALRTRDLLVFDRVPLPRPDILHKARRARFGGKTYDDSIARARIAQAFGRLIRRADDKGVFVMLDAAAPTRLFSGLPPGVTLERVGLVEAIEATAAFLAK